MGCTDMREHTHALIQNPLIDKGIDNIMAKTQAVYVFKKKKKGSPHLSSRTEKSTRHEPHFRRLRG